MSFNTVRYDVADNILTLTLYRPDHLNAFTVEMAHELIDAFERASDDDDVRAIVVTGEGRAFCAGMDLSGEGNVFGLNEDLAPTMDDMEQRLDDPEMIAEVLDVPLYVVHTSCKEAFRDWDGRVKKNAPFWTARAMGTRSRFLKRNKKPPPRSATAS